LSPFQVVFIRTTIAAIGLNAVLLLRGGRLPHAWADLRAFLAMGMVNLTLPFALIAWAEISVDSGLASVLNSTAAFGTLIVAHFSFADERITAQKLIGVIVGFIGVVVLFSRALSPEGLASSSLIGQLAVVAGAMCYAVGGVMTRKAIQRLHDPLVVSAGTMIVGAITSGIGMVVAPLFGSEPAAPLADVSSGTLLAVGALGLINTFIAYLLFYRVIQDLGAARASMVTYVVPVVGVTIGVLLGDTTLSLTLVIGSLLILLGIAIVNVRLDQFKVRQAAAPAGD
ncbi:MAG: DMT family transporter, partial [Anaerolinea sp.]|nr:DMT family transporter [Anaerolinea sp.]